MSVKILIEVTADTLAEAFGLLGQLDTKPLAPSADKQNTAKVNVEKTPAPKPTGVRATPPGALVGAVAAPTPAAEATTESAPVITAAMLIQKAGLVVNDASWGSSIEDRKAQVMAIPKKYGVNKFAEISDPTKSAAAFKDLESLQANAVS